MAGRGAGHIKWGFVFSFTWRCGGGGGDGAPARSLGGGWGEPPAPEFSWGAGPCGGQEADVAPSAPWGPSEDGECSI